MIRRIKPGENIEDWLLEELTKAYFEARKGKRSTNDEQLFEINSFENLINLRDSILDKRYKPSRGIAFVTRKPVIREIFAAPFRDRIVHHFLYNGVADWWDRRFIYDSYSCRLEKGTWFGIYRLAKHMQAASENFSKETYVVKLDIQGYFMSLSRKKLFERIMWGLDQQYPDKGKEYKILKYLWWEIIFDDPTKNVKRRGSLDDWNDLPKSKSLFCQPPGQGIVIGNLSSQLLSNIYLDQLDRYVTMELGYKHYGRYVDDFFFFVQAKDLDKAKDDIRRIELFLKHALGLTLHPRKRYVQKIEKGVSFLGAVVFPHRIVTGKRIARNFRKAVREFSAGKKEVETVVSYMGLLKNLKGKKLTKKIFEEVGWDFKD